MVVRILIFFIFLVIVFFCVRFYFLGVSSREMKPKLGVINGNLLTCGEKPNCVSTTDARVSHRMETLTFSYPREEMKQKLLKALSELSNTTVITENDDYIYATYRSVLFGFIDDMEFYFPKDKLYMRSASRVGHSDFGQNRKRLDMVLEMVK